jgi:leucyl-tRNA synthetase
VSDNFLDNSWYFLRYPSANRPDVPFDKALTKKWLPVTSYIGGNEHAVLHLLYSRFITMVLHDMGYLDFEEPFTRFRAHGLIIKDGAKMSKTKGNVVVPDEFIDRWGADAFRTYLMFLGPYEEGGDFRDSGISGVRRFLDRLWLALGEHTTEGSPDGAVMRKLHQTIRKVGLDIPKLSYNTAVAAMMEYMNTLRKGERTPHRAEVEPVIQLVAPFAPHLAEELWERLGHTRSVFDSGWPAFDESLAREEAVQLAVQVNGKLRGTITVSPSVTQDDALAAASAEPNIAKFVTGPIRKVIFVPGRLLNIVLSAVTAALLPGGGSKVITGTGGRHSLLWSRLPLPGIANGQKRKGSPTPAARPMLFHAITSRKETPKCRSVCPNRAAAFSLGSPPAWLR